MGKSFCAWMSAQPEVYHVLGWAYGFEGDVPQALAALDRDASLLPPNDPTPIDQRGDVLRAEWAI